LENNGPSLAWMFLIIVGLVMSFVVLSPKAKRKLGIWMIASADADDCRREFFKHRHSHVQEMTIMPDASAEQSNKLTRVRREFI